MLISTGSNAVNNYTKLKNQNKVQTSFLDCPNYFHESFKKNFVLLLIKSSEYLPKWVK